ncbi:hypothetical protein RCO27_03040 [Sphingosinicella sp. LHD-64]|uniref:hypothetical protein n=1 Tax=Sphingosinicella sp. LHD-64 TaxID=3072139 RepID=UPI00280E4BCB|nr:hypothetical protein [Sphingosinicella sp. LHD-64]MDQ8755196.1 hypothetical protein [Sphingosinicella sp. LHD-64]
MMTKRRKTVRRSFLAAVAGASGLALAACSDSGQQGSSDPSGNNGASSRESESSDSDSDSG